MEGITESHRSEASDRNLLVFALNYWFIVGSPLARRSPLTPHVNSDKHFGGQWRQALPALLLARSPFLSCSVTQASFQEYPITISLVSSSPRSFGESIISSSKFFFPRRNRQVLPANTLMMTQDARFDASRLDQTRFERPSIGCKSRIYSTSVGRSEKVAHACRRVRCVQVDLRHPTGKKVCQSASDRQHCDEFTEIAN